MRETGIGIIGFGFIGKVHASAYLDMPLFYDPLPLRPKLVGVATSRQESAAKAQRLAPFALATSDWRALIDNDDIDIIHICTPNATHKDILLAAIAAGKHIYCDKPLALDLAEAQEIVAALKNYQGISQMTLQNRFLPATLRAKELIDEGALGRIVAYRGAYLHAGYADPERPMSWRLDRAQAGGGSLFDLGAHIVDLLQHLVGPFRRVYCTTDTLIPERPLPDGSGRARVDVDDVAYCMVENPQGVVGTVESSRMSTGVNDALRFEIHGDRGALRFNLEEPNWLEYYDGTAPGEPHGGTRGFTRIECCQRYGAPVVLPSPKFAIGWLRAHMHSQYCLLDAIAHNRPARPDLRDGAALQAFLAAAYRSADSRQWEDVPQL